MTKKEYKNKGATDQKENLLMDQQVEVIKKINKFIKYTIQEWIIRSPLKHLTNRRQLIKK